MNLDKLEELSDHAIRHGDYSVENCWLHEVRPEYVKAMCQLIRQQHEALKLANTNKYFKAAVDALANYEEFNK